MKNLARLFIAVLLVSTMPARADSVFGSSACYADKSYAVYLATTDAKNKAFDYCRKIGMQYLRNSFAPHNPACSACSGNRFKCKVEAEFDCREIF